MATEWCDYCFDEYDDGYCHCTKCAKCGATVRGGRYKYCYYCNQSFQQRGNTDANPTGVWTQYNGEWAACIKTGDPHSGDFAKLSKKAGGYSTVKLGRLMGENEYGTVFAIEHRK